MQDSWSSLHVLDDLEEATDRDAGARIEEALQGSSGPRILLGEGAVGTLAFLHACRTQHLDALVTVAAPLVLGDLSKERPVQPLEMLLNLEVPLLLLDEQGSRDAALARERLAAFSRTWEEGELAGPDPDPVHLLDRIQTFATDFLDLAQPDAS